MSTTIIDKRIAEPSPRLLGRIAGALYAVNVVTSLVATAAYVGVTILFYLLFKPVNKRLSAIAAAFSIMGCAPGILNPFHITPYHINSLVFFGFYCLLIGFLILKSTFLPRAFAALMIFAGLGWLT